MQLIATVVVLLRILEILLVLRAVLSWFPNGRGNPVMQFVTMLTEPLLAPVRTLLYRLFPGLQRFPFDISFLIVFAVLQLLISLL